VFAAREIYKAKSYSITNLYRPLGIQEVEAYRIYRKSEHESGKAVSSTHQPPLHRKENPGFSFLLGAESTLWT
jgi:hypothetical protein